MRRSGEAPESFLRASAESLQGWCDQLAAHLVGKAAATERYEVSVYEDKERHIFLPRVLQTAHGVPTEYIISREFLVSDDYRAIASLGEKLISLLEAGAYIKRGEKVRPVDSFAEALDWLMTESKKGHTIQRYKGLGEMNPDQLWETTMDPETRRMLQVTIEDAIAADQIFTTLMGDQVEPRRDFIETNALNVSNLDI